MRICTTLSSFSEAYLLIQCGISHVLCGMFLSISQHCYIHNIVSQALEFLCFPERITNSLQLLPVVLAMPKPDDFSGGGCREVGVCGRLIFLVF